MKQNGEIKIHENLLRLHWKEIFTVNKESFFILENRVVLI